MKQQEEKLQKSYQEKDKALKKREEETELLRQNAEKDAMQKAEEAFAIERTQLHEEFKQKEDTLRKEIQQKIKISNEAIKQVNEKITNFNYDITQMQLNECIIKQQEEELKEYKRLVEQLLGRPIEESDFKTMTEKEEKLSLTINENQNYVPQDLDSNEIQTNNFTNNDMSVFDTSKEKQWTEIGHLVIEKSKEKEKFAFSKVSAENLSKYLSNKKNIQICKDGLVIYNGVNTNIVAVRMIEKTEDGYTNLYKFYSNTMVIPVQSLVTIMNLVGNINKKVCGCEIKKLRQPIEMELGCIICSNKKHKNGKEHQFEELEDEIYVLRYKNESQNSFKAITDYLFQELNCSTKEMSQKEKERIEKQALVTHMRYVEEKNENILDKISILDVEEEEIEL